MGKITKIEEQKKKKNRVNIYIDGNFVSGLYKETVVKHHLYKGKDLNETELLEIKRSEELIKAKEKALKYLSYRLRSRKEVKDYLSSKKFSKRVIGELLDDLEDAHLLDDNEFARLWVKDRNKRNPKGNYILRKELQRKGIDSNTIDRILGENDERKNALTVAQKALKKYSGRNDCKQKILSYLSRRGFPHSICIEITDNLMENN